MHAWSRPSLGEGLGLLCLGAVPLLALATHSQIIVPIAVLALLGLGGRAPWPRDPLLVLAGLFCLWAALSLSWTPASGAAAWRPAYTVPLVFLAGVALSRGSLAPLALPTLAVSMLLGAGGVFAAWGLGWESLVPFNAALSVWVLLLAPLLAGLLQQGRPRLTLAVAGGVTAAVLLGDSEASKLALILGAGGAGLAWVLARPALVLRAVLWGFVPVVVAMPWVIQAVLSDATFRALAPMMGFSLQHRMVIWQFVAARIAEHPVFGWGLGAARAFRGAKETVAVVLPGVGWQDVPLERLPIHPHNMPLQLWLETGGVGVALVCVGLLVLGARAKTGPRERSWSTAVRVGGVVAGLSLTLASYEAWQAWILLSAALAVGVDRRGFWMEGGSPAHRG